MRSRLVVALLVGIHLSSLSSVGFAQDDAPSQLVLQELAKSESQPTTVTYSTDLGLVYVGTQSGRVQAFKTETAELIWSRQLHSQPIAVLCSSRRGPDLLTAGFDGKLLLIDGRSGDVVNEIQSDAFAITCALSSSNGETWIVGTGGAGAKGEVRELSRDLSKTLATYSGHELRILELSWLGANEECICSSSMDGTVRVWNRKSKESTTIAQDLMGPRAVYHRGDDVIVTFDKKGFIAIIAIVNDVYRVLRSADLRTAITGGILIEECDALALVVDDCKLILLDLLLMRTFADSSELPLISNCIAIQSPAGVPIVADAKGRLFEVSWLAGTVADHPKFVDHEAMWSDLSSRNSKLRIRAMNVLAENPAIMRQLVHARLLQDPKSEEWSRLLNSNTDSKEDTAQLCALARSFGVSAEPSLRKKSLTMKESAEKAQIEAIIDVLSRPLVGDGENCGALRLLHVLFVRANDDDQFGKLIEELEQSTKVTAVLNRIRSRRGN